MTSFSIEPEDSDVENPWIYAREVARILCCDYGQVPAIAEANNVRRRVIPGTWIKYHKDDALDLARASIQGKGRVGVVADQSEVNENGSRLVLADRTEAAPRTRITKKATVSQR